MATADFEHTKCRQAIEDSLMSLMKKTAAPPQSIFLYGHTATGKSLCIQNILTQLHVTRVIVQCTEVYTPKLLFELIISRVNGSLTSTRCEDMSTFIRLLKQSLRNRTDNVYLVFEKAERLRTMPANILPALLRLAEFVSYPICVVLESELVWENFRVFPTGMYEPHIIHFPEYSKEDMVDILVTTPPPGVNSEFYCTYCQLIVNVFYSLTRNLRELSHLVRVNYHKYREPIENGTIDENNSRALFKAIEPSLRAAMSTIYLHEVSDRQWEESTQEVDGAIHLAESHIKQMVELPYFSKYLLIAAYLSSYNPAASDRRFFVKNAGKLRKLTNQQKKNYRTSGQVLGPKLFPLDRMMAIFYSIVDGKVLPTTQIYTQITNLVTLQLLACTSESQFDSPKYKCLINLEFAKSISRSVGFDIVCYLYDFI